MNETLGAGSLDHASRRVLEFERIWRGGYVPKERAVRELLGLSPARYAQLLDRALDLPASLRHDPSLVARLRSQREARRRRFAPPLGFARTSG
ncbi:MAG: DUF3263 domain-containing protein [Candidatus Velamenicoccus archaeovorus]